MLLLLNSILDIEFINQTFNVPDKTLNLINDFWKSACEIHKNLYDGTIYHVDRYSKSALNIQPIPFRFFYAQNKMPELQTILNIHVLAVSGLLCFKDGICIGKRKGGLTYPDFWECVPSGMVEGACTHEVDLHNQLMREYKEELPELTYPDEIKIFGLYYDKPTSTIDIIFKMKLNKSWKEVQAAFANKKIFSEHDKFKCISYNASSIKILEKEPLLPMAKACLDFIMTNHSFNCQMSYWSI